MVILPPFGGDEENRTPDPLLARQVLSQLSYTPVLNRARKYFPTLFHHFEGTSFRKLVPSKLNNDLLIRPVDLRL